MSEKVWILSAIQDLQDLAIQHSLEDVANALADVLSVAIREVEADKEQRLERLAEEKQRSLGEVVNFPRNRSGQSNWNFSH